MEIKIDTSKIYAVALEGGGARGGYEIGAWRALEEAGVKYNAVAGTSVGALNGALMAMRQLDKAIELWENVSFSKVMDVDDELMKKLFAKDFLNLDIRAVVEGVIDVLKDRGFDIAPLRRWIASEVDEQRIRQSDVELFIKTFSLSDRKELDIDVKQLPEGQLCDMLLASAYFPAFKNEKLGGKRYTDGGVQDVLPISSLISRGYKDIIAIRVFGWGHEKRVKMPKDAKVITIKPNDELGNILNFSSEQARSNMKQGYFDAQRVIYGLDGKEYYIERTWTEQEAYERITAVLDDGACSLREMNEEVIPKLGRRLDSKESYYELLLDYLELAGHELEVPEFEIRTDEEFFHEVMLFGQTHNGKKLKSELKPLIMYSRSDRYKV